MTVNKEKVIEVIMGDAEITHAYINAEGQTCAIGGLAKAAGYELDYELMEGMKAPGYAEMDDFSRNLRKLNSKRIGHIFDSDDINPVVEMGLLIHKTYGLTASQMRSIQHINDAFSDREERQRAIVEFVETLR